ncbi:kinase-like domain-containing protein [Mycena olivaceomarginata]|nr:kinase-like domain-containing protein [Mycena olivaceomarginata]
MCMLQPYLPSIVTNLIQLHLLDSDQYVAKRFYQLETDAVDSAISLDDNRIEVESEVIRLAQGKWFLDAFYRFCKGYKEVSFADAFLAVEIKKPSKASGLASIPDEQEEGLTWIVERKRPTTVIKFSGTLIHHSHRTDLRSATISAFAHFVYGYSNKSLVFADLQGTPSRIKGKDGLVLFDLMTHTISEDSGVGDFGLEGIKTFLNGHKCSKVCSTLGTEEQYRLSLPDVEDEDGDGCDQDQEDHEYDTPLQVHA